MHNKIYLNATAHATEVKHKRYHCYILEEVDITILLFLAVLGRNIGALGATFFFGVS
jgi:hypothetical protein